MLGNALTRSINIDAHHVIYPVQEDHQALATAACAGAGLIFLLHAVGDRIFEAHARKTEVTDVVIAHKSIDRDLLACLCDVFPGDFLRAIVQLVRAFGHELMNKIHHLIPGPEHQVEAHAIFQCAHQLYRGSSDLGRFVVEAA